MQDVLQTLINGSIDMLTNLAQVLETTAVHIYKVLVIQQVVEGVLAMAGMFGIFAGAFFFTRYVDKRLTKHYKKDYMVEDKLLVWAFGLFLSFSLLSKAIPVATLSLNKVINPEYYVIKSIWTEVKN